MRKRNPWTLLRNRLKPLTEALHEAAPWRVSSHAALVDWIQAQTWDELRWGDDACEPLCKEPPKLAGVLFDPRVASEEEHPTADVLREWMTRQMMHRMIFALDLSRAMRPAWRQAFALKGDWPSDARMILIDGWRTNAALEWAQEFGHLYLGGPEE